MGWGKVVQLIIEFIKWMWQNKWTIVFLICSIILFCNNVLKNKENDKLNTEIDELNNSLKHCESINDDVMKYNDNLLSSFELCRKEINIIEKSYNEQKGIIEKFNEEISHYSQLAKEIDSEQNSEMAFEKKKMLIEELFKSKNSYQINTIKQKINIKFKTNK